MAENTIHNWAVAAGGGTGVPLSAVPDLSYGQFVADMRALLLDEKGLCVEQNRCVAYFAVPSEDKGKLRFYALVARDEQGDVLVASHVMEYYDEGSLESLAAEILPLHIYEREIAELYGVKFRGAPWDKPLRYPYNRYRQENRMENYPFYEMESADLHQVQVGPVHAGIIEPGAFRFLCDGERIVHLEIALGYQHRGVESLIAATGNRLRQMALAESIAGDTAVGNAIAMARILESGDPSGRNGMVECERGIALEMERIAVHIGDTGALCMDMAYQTGQVACEALRTLVINTMQDWCGNRFGKGLVRPFGSFHRLDLDRLKALETTLEEVMKRYRAVRKDLLSTPWVLARLEEVCTVSRSKALQVGAVGMAARMTGVRRDARIAHNFCPVALSEDQAFTPVIEQGGDLLSRLKVRFGEVESSYELIRALGRELAGKWFEDYPEPDYNRPLPQDALVFSLVEGWRGEICHVALINGRSEIEAYKVVDPSVHNWMMLALSVRGEQISDFPLSNKSFNLSYCGHDL